MPVRNLNQGVVERKTSAPERIGVRLRNLRCRRGLSQRELQQKAGLMRCYISRLENGHTVPTLEILERLAGALDLPLYWLLHEAEEPAECDSTLDGISGSVRDRMSPENLFLRKLKSLWRRMTDYDREMLVLVAGRMAARVPDVAQPNALDEMSGEASEPMQYLHVSSDACIVSSASNSQMPDS